MCGPGRALLTASRFTAPRDEHAAPCLRGGAKVWDLDVSTKYSGKHRFTEEMTHLRAKTPFHKTVFMVFTGKRHDRRQSFYRSKGACKNFAAKCLWQRKKIVKRRRPTFAGRQNKMCEQLIPYSHFAEDAWQIALPSTPAWLPRRTSVFAHRTRQPTWVTDNLRCICSADRDKTAFRALRYKSPCRRDSLSSPRST